MKKRLTILFLIFTMAFSFTTIARAEDLHKDGIVVTPLDELAIEPADGEYGARLKLFNCWLEVEEYDYYPSVTFYAGYDAHPVVKFYLPKETKVKYKMKVTYPDKRKEKFKTDWIVHSPGFYSTCLTCSFGWPGIYSQPGIHSLKIQIIAKGAGQAIDRSKFLVLEAP